MGKRVRVRGAPNNFVTFDTPRRDANQALRNADKMIPHAHNGVNHEYNWKAKSWEPRPRNTGKHEDAHLGW